MRAARTQEQVRIHKKAVRKLMMEDQMARIEDERRIKEIYPEYETTLSSMTDAYAKLGIVIAGGPKVRRKATTTPGAGAGGGGGGATGEERSFGDYFKGTTLDDDDDDESQNL
jgi:hypothetical protein